MNQDRATLLMAELCSVMERLVELQDALYQVIRRKLDVMRTSDPADIMRVCNEEADLSAHLANLDAARRRLVGDLCETAGMARPSQPERVTLRALSQALNVPGRERLLSLGESLRMKMLKVAEANRTVELVCREMLAHFRRLFAAFSTPNEETGTYSDKGARHAANGAAVLDAVG
ncbi:MAG: flagellar export chaperone FlgN [Phycisphaerales bacterium]|nr:flagellar export chaperone FlgN [Phycisphaerales bacterium]MCB9862532.1 flagellar export chaperone FlgN [Phycisphaerales bacterium]